MRKNPHEPFKIDQEYGKLVSYGPHEGWDTNGLGGGNTDCGTPLFPLVVESAKAIFQSFSDKGYGRLLVYQVETPRGSRWIRYAHLQEILVKNGDVLHENVPVAKMGSTGNSTACHLHWDIFKKEPPNWRWFPANRTVQDEYMIDPQEFIDVYADYETPPSDGYVSREAWQFERDERDKNWNLYRNEEIAHEETRKELKLVKEQLKNEKSAHQTDLEKIGNVLGVPADMSRILPAVETAISFEEKARDADSALKRERAEYERALKAKSVELEMVRKRVGILEEDIRNLRLKKPKNVATWSFWEYVINLFK